MIDRRPPLDLRSSPRPPSRFLGGMVLAILANAAVAAETSVDQDLALATSVLTFGQYCVPALVNDNELRPDLLAIVDGSSKGTVVREWWASEFSVMKELRAGSGLRGCQINPVPTAASSARPSPDVLATLQEDFDAWANAKSTQSVFHDVQLCKEPSAVYQRSLETRKPNPDGNYVKAFLAVFDEPRNFFIVAAEAGPKPHSCADTGES